MVNSQAEISEVFASIQGEGLFIGTMQLFIRFASEQKEVHTKTTRCDNTESGIFWLHTLPGKRNLKEKSPITATKLFNELNRHFPLKQFFCISMIGEEPLQHADFLGIFLPMLRNDGLKTFLQTSAPSEKDFTKIFPLIDYLCLDLDIPRKEHNSDRDIKRLTSIIELTTPVETCLRLTVDAHENPQILLTRLARLPISQYTLILQPRMTGLSHISDWDTGTILEWINLFSPLFAHIRWIPQVHKLLRIP